MNEEELIRLYYNNSDFNDYVNKYCAKEEISMINALSHAMVQNYALYLKERGDKETTLPNMWRETEDKSC